MITIDLRDEHLVEHTRALLLLRESGWWTDEELQKVYDKQLEYDKKGGSE